MMVEDAQYAARERAGQEFPEYNEEGTKASAVTLTGSHAPLTLRPGKNTGGGPMPCRCAAR